MGAERASLLLCVTLGFAGLTDMGAFNRPIVQTPNSDPLAAGSVGFDRVYTQCVLCDPAGGSLSSR